jgi:hypothetical protein
MIKEILCDQKSLIGFKRGVRRNLSSLSKDLPDIQCPD